MVSVTASSLSDVYAFTSLNNETLLPPSFSKSKPSQSDCDTGAEMIFSIAPSFKATKPKPIILSAAP